MDFCMKKVPGNFCQILIGNLLVARKKVSVASEDGFNPQQQRISLAGCLTGSIAFSNNWHEAHIRIASPIPVTQASPIVRTGRRSSNGLTYGEVC
jgi:hypothetical protein